MSSILDTPKVTNKRAYDLGWHDGRAGKPTFPGNVHPDYVKGYENGYCALEEYENGCGWRRMRDGTNSD